jgi:NADH dehydrogenase [ubiquinone] 1 alpha subcomplex assembly factor 1
MFFFFFGSNNHLRPRTQIPFDGFVMTKAGTINTQPVSMLRERVRSVGISLLGGNAGIEGPYELGIAEIRAVNEEDLTVPPRTSLHLSPYLRLLNFWPVQ